MKLNTLIATILIGNFLLGGIVHAECKEAKRSYTAADLDMSNLKGVRDKKQRFFNFLRPIVNAENKKIELDRQRLLIAKEKGNNQAWVKKMAEEYSVDWDGSEQSWNKLLERVDVVPRELVLAQSANESAWGQSRFAKEGNNFFGLWCRTRACGMVPKHRAPGDTRMVESFDSVNASVESYLKHINTTDVYAPLRKIRAEARSRGKEPDAYKMAAGLVDYSSRRQDYVDEIRLIIRINKELMQCE